MKFNNEFRNKRGERKRSQNKIRAEWRIRNYQSFLSISCVFSVFASPLNHPNTLLFIQNPTSKSDFTENPLGCLLPFKTHLSEKLREMVSTGNSISSCDIFQSHQPQMYSSSSILGELGKEESISKSYLKLTVFVIIFNHPLG